MRKACIWIPSMLSGNTVRPKDFYQHQAKLVCLYIYLFTYIFPFPVSAWITFMSFRRYVQSSWLVTEPYHLGVQTKLQKQSKATPVSSCVVLNLVLIYSRKMCVLLLLGGDCTNTFFCGCFAQLKQVINFSNSGYTNGWRYLCGAKQMGRGNFWVSP